MGVPVRRQRSDECLVRSETIAVVKAVLEADILIKDAEGYRLAGPLPLGNDTSKAQAFPEEAEAVRYRTSLMRLRTESLTLQRGY